MISIEKRNRIIYGIYSVYHKRIVYVGQTVKSLRSRFSDHLEDARKGSDYAIHRALRKYGESNFIPQILLPLFRVNNTETDTQEIFLIEKYNTYKKGYNETIGGGSGLSGYNHTEKTKKIISEKTKERWKNDRDKMISYLKGVPRNRIFTDKDRELSRKICLKYRPSSSIVAREKIRQSALKRIGDKNPHSHKWIITDPRGNKIEIISLKNFCKENQLSYPGMYYSWKEKNGLPCIIGKNKGWSVVKKSK